MSHQINSGGTPIRGSASFSYRKHVISLSTVFDAGDRVGVWTQGGWNSNANPVNTFHSVEEAIDWTRKEDMGDNA